MIIKKEKKGNIMIYIVEKDFDDSKLSKILNKKLNNKNNQYFIIEDDADVYTNENKLLMRFRKNVLNKEHIKTFYDNVIQFAKMPTNNRGSASGSKKKNIREPLGPAVDPAQIQVIIVPALHINHEGYRLGQGGGSYDRALAGSAAWTIGLVYAGELTNENIFVAPHDQKLNAAATPALIVRFV